MIVSETTLVRKPVKSVQHHVFFEFLIVNKQEQPNFTSETSSVSRKLEEDKDTLSIIISFIRSSSPKAQGKAAMNGGSCETLIPLY